VKQDGLVHVSQLSNRFVSDPNEVVKLQQKVMVMITEVDVARKRIALSMKDSTTAKENLNKEKKMFQSVPNKPATKTVSANSFHDKLADLKKKFGN
jgi:uncharacterized protein